MNVLSSLIQMISKWQTTIAAVILALVMTVGGCGSDAGMGKSDIDPVSGDATFDGMVPDSGLDGESSTLCPDDEPGKVRPEWWGELSHCRGAPPDYDRLFPGYEATIAGKVVHRFDILIDPEVYKATQDDLKEKLSGGGPGGKGGVEDPMWGPVTVEYDGLSWSHVGMRYKGNSSLKAAFSSGIRKLAFRLNFDMYEDYHPELEDQRFFGFKKMTFSNGFKDMSFIRDRLAADIFRDGGIPAARGAFARIYVDFGEGPVYFGLYAMIEDPSNRMLDTQFEDDGGNLYKPDGPAANWDSHPQWETLVKLTFDKKTNEDQEDWSDVIAAFQALHADRTDKAKWRAGLEAAFDVHGFLRCLALNQAMVNWDSYGVIAHNYYLYGDPSREGRLVWFPWDLNEAMLHKGFGPHQGNSESVMLDEADSKWPLIRFLLDDPEYRQFYQEQLVEALEGSFAVDRIHERMDAFHELVAPYVVGPDGETAPYTFLKDASDFENSLNVGKDALKPHVETRHEAVKLALGLK